MDVDGKEHDCVSSLHDKTRDNITFGIHREHMETRPWVPKAGSSIEYTGLYKLFVSAHVSFTRNHSWCLRIRSSTSLAFPWFSPAEIINISYDYEKYARNAQKTNLALIKNFIKRWAMVKELAPCSADAIKSQSHTAAGSHMQHHPWFHRLQFAIGRTWQNICVMFNNPGRSAISLNVEAWADALVESADCDLR